jgi:hypothetical protein
VVGKPEGKGTLEEPKHSLEDNIKMDLEETVGEDRLD